MFSALFVCAIAVLPSRLPPAGPVVTAPVVAPVWGVWEAQIDVPDADPNTQVFAKVATARGRTFSVPGFVDSMDGRTFRVRVMPQELGQHQVELWVNQAEPSRSSKAQWKGAFTSMASDIRGPLRVDEKHPFHFVWASNNEHYFLNGTTAYLLLGWDDETITKVIDRLASLKVNRIRVGLNVRSKPGSWSKTEVRETDKFKMHLEPWVAQRPNDMDNPGYDVKRFNIQHWQKMDRLMAYAQKKNVFISALFYVDGLNPGTDPFGAEGAGGPDEQKYYEYAVARLAAFSNLTWDVSNEYRLFRSDEWADRMGALIKKVDPFGHLVSVHGHADFRFRKSAWADFAMYQQWDDCGGYTFMLQNRLLQSAVGRPIPQVNEEYGYEDLYPGFGCGFGGTLVSAPGRNADSRRRLAWDIAMAGGYQTSGERFTDGTGSPPDTGGGWINGRGNDSMKLFNSFMPMVDFFTSLPWWQLEPHPELVGPGLRQALAIPGKLYVMRLPGGGKGFLRLPKGAFTAEQVDPRNGKRTDLGSVMGPVWQAPAMPANEDWVFVVRVR
jgi:hypothetical protein